MAQLGVIRARNLAIEAKEKKRSEANGRAVHLDYRPDSSLTTGRGVSCSSRNIIRRDSAAERRRTFVSTAMSDFTSARDYETTDGAFHPLLIADLPMARYGPAATR
ncbi:MAG: hypothetical protein WA156_01240 [Methylocystis silviterrae]